MANVYRIIYRGDFCSDNGNSVIVEFSKRMDEGLPIPAVLPIKFAGESPVSISYPDKGDYKLNPINGSECTINIHADGDFELSSLYTADEREWLIKVSGTTSWVGYLIPDKCSEPFLSKPYDVSVSATDSLGTLSDIPFENLDGTKIRGKRSDREILMLALAKTGLSLGMVIAVNLYETSMTNKTVNGDPLSQAFIDTYRFIDESFKSFSCEEVIRSILARYSSRLRQLNGEWQMVRMPELELGPVQGRRFASNGTYSGLVTLGSNIIAGGADREIKPVGNTYFGKAFLSSVAYYQYGYIGNSLVNGNMDTWTTKPTGLPDGWETFGSGTVDAITQIRQFNGADTTDYYIEFRDLGNGGVRNINQVQIRANDAIKFSMDLFSPGSISGSSNRNNYISILIQDDAGKYFTNTGWQNSPGYYVIRKNKQDFFDQQSINFDISPQSVDFKITFGILPVGDTANNHFYTRINNVTISSGTDSAIKPGIGRYNKQTQLSNQTYTEDPVLLLHGDDDNTQRTSLIYINDLPSVSWVSAGVTKTILQWVASSELKAHSRPYRIFEAEFYSYGQIDPNTLLTVDLLEGNFTFLSGDFNLKTEVHSLRFAQVITDNITVIEDQQEDYGTSSDKSVSVASPSGVSNGTGTSFVDLSEYAKITDIPVKATNVETQAGTDDAKFITPSKLANWWSYIKGLAQTISGVWNFTARPTYNGGNLLIASDIAGKANTSDVNSALALKAPLADPVFTGNPTVPDQLAGDNDQSAANTKFVTTAISNAFASFMGSDRVLSKSANYTIVMADFGSNGQSTVYVDTTSGNVSITLPAAATMNGFTVNVIKVSSDTNSVMVIGTINSMTNDFLSNQFDSAIYKSNSTNIFKF